MIMIIATLAHSSFLSEKEEKEGRGRLEERTDRQLEECHAKSHHATWYALKRREGEREEREIGERGERGKRERIEKIER